MSAEFYILAGSLTYGVTAAAYVVGRKRGYSAGYRDGRRDGNPFAALIRSLGTFNRYLVDATKRATVAEAERITREASDGR